MPTTRFDLAVASSRSLFTLILTHATPCVGCAAAVGASRKIESLGRRQWTWLLACILAGLLLLGIGCVVFGLGGLCAAVSGHGSKLICVLSCCTRLAALARLHLVARNQHTLRLFHVVGSSRWLHKLAQLRMKGPGLESGPRQKTMTSKSRTDESRALCACINPELTDMSERYRAHALRPA